MKILNIFFLLLFFATSLYSQKTVKKISEFTTSNGLPQQNTTSALAIGNKYFFAAYDEATGNELYVTDGTSAGTLLVKDINQGSAGSDLQKFIELNGVLFFIANDGKNGAELWKSDGTSAGTLLVKDINNLPSSSILQPIFAQLIAYKNLLYFNAYTSDKGEEIYVSDGTSSGTKLLKDIIPGSSGDGLNRPFILNDKLYFFTTPDVFEAIELWTTDGTSAGTKKILSFNQGGFEPTNVQDVAVNSSGAYVTLQYGFDNLLYFTDATANGTKFIKRIESSEDMVALDNGKLLFTVSGGNNEDDIWVSDGTTDGTKVLKDFNYFFSDIPYSLVKFKGLAYALINDKDFCLFLSTDGTTINNLYEFQTTTSGSDKYIKVLDNELFIMGYKNYETATEIYTSDGTSAGTSLLVNLNKVEGRSSNPVNFDRLDDGSVIFIAEEISSDRELFIYQNILSGTLNQTSVVKCFGDKTAKITSTVIGGVPPYSYKWSNGATTDFLENLGKGDYSVTITDAVGQKYIGQKSVTEPSKLEVLFTSLPENQGKEDGSISLNVSGGKTPYKYKWSNGKTLGTISNLKTGTYSCTVTDANNCTSIVEIKVDQLSSTDQQTLFCNYLKTPFFDTYINLDNCRAAASFSLLNIFGQSILSGKLSEGSNEIDTKTFATGIYFLNIFDNGKRKTFKVIKN